MDNQTLDCVIIGAGLTGLSTAHHLSAHTSDIRVIECLKRVGGQIHTIRRDGFVIESGPNTGIISNPEVAELFDDYPGLLQTARAEAKRRFILKKGRFRPLPSGLISAIKTDLFSWKDKLGILLEPWVKPGTDSNESISSLVQRRLGKSYLDYAVDPFVGGIYAGDPELLVTRHALPKLYALEAKYGSFIRGAIALSKQAKSQREKRATKEVFSVKNGLSTLTDTIASRLTEQGLLDLGISHLRASYLAKPKLWQLDFLQDSEPRRIYTHQLVSTIGTIELDEAMSPLGDKRFSELRALRYAPIVQVAVGYRIAPQIDFDAFGGLIPSIEDKEMLGILNPSATFSGRCPEGGLLLNVFLGGLRAPDVIAQSDEYIQTLVRTSLEKYLGIYQKPDILELYRHPRAIPQYEASTDRRLELIQQLEQDYSGLLIGGNMHNGIGIPDRIKQGVQLAERVLERINNKPRKNSSETNRQDIPTGDNTNISNSHCTVLMPTRYGAEPT